MNLWRLKYATVWNNEVIVDYDDLLELNIAAPNYQTAVKLGERQAKMFMDLVDVELMSVELVCDIHAMYALGD